MVVAAKLMEFSEANDLPQKYETNPNPEHKKILLICFCNLALFSGKSLKFVKFIVITKTGC